MSAPKTFGDFDQFQLSEFASELTSFIAVERQFVEGSLVLSVNAPFGTGKSTFFEMWQNQLQQTGGETGVVSLNAWQEDYIDDPLLAIIFQLLEFFDKAEIEESKLKKLKDSAGKVARFSLSLGNDIVAKATGVNIINAGKKANDESLVEDNVVADQLFDTFRNRHSALQSLKANLREAIEDTGISHLIVIIDELDRCRPDYSISYLETIKHIFDLEELTFVIGIDPITMESAAQALFGSKLNFHEYYRKFVHRTVELPKLNNQTSRSFCSSLVSQYLTEKDQKGELIRYHFGSIEGHDIKNMAQICERLHLTARQIHEVFRIVGHVLTCSDKQHGNMQFGWKTTAFFMAALSVGHKDTFLTWASGNASFQEIGRFLDSKGFLGLADDRKEWWCKLLFLAHRRRNNWDYNEILKVFQDLGFYTNQDRTEDENLSTLHTELGRFSSQGFDSHHESSSVTETVGERIMGLTKFGA